MGKRSKKKNSKIISALSAVVIFVAGVIVGAIANVYGSLPEGYEIPATERPSVSAGVGEGYAVETIKENELSIHFLELGNKYTGDCTLIDVGETEILIDAGSKADSVETIKEYIDDYVDGVLDYVVITHAHEDHYAGFATTTAKDSIFDLYECETVITFSQTTSGKTTQKMYGNYQRELAEELSGMGNDIAVSNHYTAEECIKGINGASRTYDLGSGVEMEILDSKFYYEVAETENDHSVCLMINQTSADGNTQKHYLFTGDLEKEGEESLVELNDLPQVELYKAGHHGSKTSSNTVLMEVIQPKIVCVCCCAGSSEYTKTNANQFPTQDFIDRIAPYTSNVYVTSLCVDYQAGSFTSMNGNIAVCADASDLAATVYCSNEKNNKPLKDSEWFKENREVPSNWAS